MRRAGFAHALLNGRQIFRYDTFGDEAFWGDTIKLHQAIQGARFGGVGSGLSPRVTLETGLKVDVDALPHALGVAFKGWSSSQAAIAEGATANLL